MAAELMARHQKTLLRLEDKCRKRFLTCTRGIDFTSNDYLALTHSARIKNAIKNAIDNGISVGAGGSRLLRGNHEVFEKLETEAAAFFKSERALYFNNGYAANLALFSTLPRKGDIVLYDELVHASILDGIRLGRAQAIRVAHNNIENFAGIISDWRKKGGTGRPWIAVESLYSMDGEQAPLIELFNLADTHEGFLVIDEAHATGVFGSNGQGLASFFEGHDNVIILHTCGKALGVSGALMCLNKTFCDYLINRARAFIYSTAPPPLVAVGVSEALKIISDEPIHRAKLRALFTYANNQITKLTGRGGSGSQILPIIIGKDQHAVAVANRLQREGYDIRAIRPPTVAEGTSRLRITITLHVSKKDIDLMLAKLRAIIEEEKL